MRRAVERPWRGRVDLLELLHQVRLRVEAAGGVGDDDVAPRGRAASIGVVDDGGGVDAFLAADDVHAEPLRPDG